MPEHRKVIFTGTEDLIGQFINIEIEKCIASTLLGKIVESQIT
jgi:hypothetical protein